jgi:archaemetzincin
MKNKILIKGVGKIDNKILIWIKPKLEEIFNCDVEIETNLALPHYAYTEKRKQYNSSLILENINTPKNFNKMLLIIDNDLYAEGLNFVFGEAYPLKKIAMISLARLRQSFYGLKEDKNIFYERILKEAVHELGHLYRLKHCPNPNCVMHFSNTILDTDRKSYNFCPKCRKLLKLR